jgi:hypothetical protein
MAKQKQSVASLKKEVNFLKRQVSALTREAPPRPEDTVARAGQRADYLKVTPGNADYRTPVLDTLERLKGRSNLQQQRRRR